MAQASSNSFTPHRRQLAIIAVLIIALYVLIPQIGSFHNSLQLLRRPQLSYLLLTLGLTALSYLAAAALYIVLAFKPLPYQDTLLVQVASVFINRLLPGGVGALGVNYLYLRHKRHTSAQAAAIVSVNNLLGLLGHSVLLTLLLMLFANHLPAMKHLPHVGGQLGWVGVALLLAVIVSLWRASWRHKLQAALSQFGSQLLAYRKRPGHLLLGLGISMCLTLATIGSLWAALLAVHASVSFISVMIAFTFGLSVGTATPTPGGLGGLEAGLVAALIAYQVPSATALAGVLLYRLISYWLGMVFGAVAFGVVQRKQLLKV